MEQEIMLAQPRGFCAGVDRAIEIVEQALMRFGAPIYVRHEIVHNAYVVSNLRERGAIFIESLENVPKDSIVVFSAHGVSQAIHAEAKARGLKIFDATCPLVTKVHLEVARMVHDGCEVIMIGHSGHPEVEGTMGQVEEGMYLVETLADVEKLKVRDPSMLAYVSQTTLSLDDTEEIINAIKIRFPKVRAPHKSDICYATTNRQQAVKFMAPQVDMVIVVGSPNSSNSNRLREVTEKMGTRTYMVDDAHQIQPDWLKDCSRIGVTAGASAPEILVQAVIERIKQHGPFQVRNLNGTEETVHFSLPKELRAT